MLDDPSDEGLTALITAARSGDVEAAFEVGQRTLAQDAVFADRFFRLAVRGGGFTVMVKVINHLEQHPERARGWIRIWRERAGLARFSLAEAPCILVAQTVFATASEDPLTRDLGSAHLVVQAVDAALAARVITEVVNRADAPWSLPQFALLRTDEFGTHIEFLYGAPTFVPLLSFIEALIGELTAAGIWAAYIRSEDTEPWTPIEFESAPTFPDDIARDAAGSADDPTGEAAFAVASWCHDHRFRYRGDVWFKRAAASAPFDMTWRIIDDYACKRWGNGVRLADWMRRAWELEFPSIDALNIRVDAMLFAPILRDGRAGRGHDASVRVLSTQAEAATRALTRASGRFGLVTSDGRVFATYEDLEAAEPEPDGDWSGYYSPNFVSDVDFDADGNPQLWMDWKDVMAPLMGRAMVYVLIEELLAEGVTRARISPRQRAPR